MRTIEMKMQEEVLIYINARSVMCNLNHIEIMINHVKPMLIFCTEARITNEICDEVNIDGYSNVICSSESRFTGGVSIYIIKNIQFKIVFMKSIDKNIWCLAIEIINSHLNGIYCCFYRANNAREEIFDVSFDELLTKTIKQNKLFLCVGDLNLNMDDNSNKKVRNFKTMLDMHGLHYVSDFFTRITHESQTKIDVILTNDEERVKCQIIPNEKISDHETIKINILHEKKIQNETQMVNSWKNYAKNQLIENLREENWQNFELMNVDEMVEKMRKNLNNAVEPMVRKVLIRPNTNTKTWYDNQLYELKNQRDEKYRRWASTNLRENWNAYVESRNTYNKTIKWKKENSIKNEIKKSSGNQRAMWKCLSKILPQKKYNQTNCEIVFGNVASTDKNEICNKFNDFFIKSILDINAQIPNVNNVIQTIQPTHYFTFRNVDVQKIYTIAKNLTKKVNKSQLCNSLVWFDAIDYIGHHLCTVINKSLNTGNFPNCWKLSTITPIPKVKNTNKCEEFRPVNSMPNDEKIIECVVKEQLIDYFNENNILYEYQSAYRTNHSCESALNLLLYDWKEAIENGEIVIVVFLDLKRAFETVSRDIMANKLSNIGVIGNELKWFISYMENRQQKVKFNNHFSHANNIPIGLAQGTQLSVFLFLLYINDIATAAIFGKIYLFADDTALVIRHKDLSTAINQSNSDLQNLHKKD